MSKGSAVIFVRKRKDRFEVLLQHRAVYMKHGPNKLALVQGSSQKDEDPLVTAYREAGEETNLDQYISFRKFKKHAKLLASGSYTCYVVDITHISELDKWIISPQEKYKGEINMTVFKNGHIWVKLSDIFKLMYYNKQIKGIEMWNLTRLFLLKHWNEFLLFVQ